MDRKSATREQLVALVRRAAAALEESPLAENLSQSIDRLKRHTRVWRSSAWRVGVVGITSAGKSTLLNALLTEPLLPTGVKPSSNALVLCRGGESLLARIAYKNGRVETVKSGIEARLRAVADERSNVGNRLGIEEIQLETPGFRLGDSILLVDTPGLDAFQLDAHEELTMERLVPTVDLVMFVTTTKANSDAQISTRLDRIGRHGKPVILVQNMADAVEPKLGVGGEVVKNKAEVLREHFQRVRRLLTRTGVAPLADAAIIQVSAQQALDGRFSRSGVGELVQCVESTCKQLSPAFVAARVEQLLAFLTRTIDLLDEDATTPQRRVGQEKALVRTSSTLSRSASALRTSTAPLKKRLSERFDTSLSELSALRSRQTGRLDKLLKAHAKELAAIAKTVVGAHKVALAADIKAAVSLDMPEADLRPGFKTLRPPNPELTAKKTSHRTSDQYIDRKGVGNQLMRGLGSLFGQEDWGKKLVLGKNVYQFDMSREGQRLQAQRQQQEEWLTEALAAILKDQGRRQHIVVEEIERRRTELQGLRAAAAESAAKATLVRALRTLLHEGEQLRELARPAVQRPACVAGSYVRREDGVVSAALTQLQPAHRLSTHLLACARIEMRRRLESQCGVAGPPSRSMLWGWDQDAIFEFRTRFWPTAVLAPGAETVADRDGQIVRSFLDGAQARRSPVLGRDEVLYLLFDAEQPGAACNALDRSDVLARLGPRLSRRAVFVVQSVRSASRTGSLGELLLQLRELLHPVGRFSGCLVNDEAVAYSVLFDDLLFGADRGLHADELDWVGRLDRMLAPQDSVEGQACLKALRYWREEGRT